MPKIKRIIPFSWRNVLLGLRGDSLALAEAEYYYDGQDLEKKKIELSSESDSEKDIKFLRLELNANRITEVEFSKEQANILEKPWVNVVSVGFDKNNVQDGFFELDWNKWFIKVLEESEFQGISEEDLVNHWLQTVCQNIALEDIIDEPVEEKKNKVDRKNYMQMFQYWENL